MGTIIVALIVLAICVAIIAGMLKKKKEGKSIICGVDCKSCAGACNCEVAAQELKKIEEEINRQKQKQYK